MEVIEEFFTTYTDYFRSVAHITYYLEHLNDKFESKFLDITKEMSPIERYIRMADCELEYQSIFPKFSIAYSKLMLYIKDDYLEKIKNNFADFINKTEKLSPQIRDFTLFESLLKNKKELDNYKKKMVGQYFLCFDIHFSKGKVCF